MSTLAVPRDALMPRSPDSKGPGFALALLAHAALVVALAFGVNWKASDPEGVEAELWASVPQIAAPKATEPEPTPVKPEPKPEPRRPVQAPASTGTTGTNTDGTRTSTGPATPPAESVESVESVAAVIPPDAKPLTEVERKKLIQARQLLAERRTAKELKEAYQLAREVADAHPELKEAQHLAAEGAYRISRWSDALAYFRRGGDPDRVAALLRPLPDVRAVESWDAAGAAAALKRALPNLKRTAYVDSYVGKIQGK